MRFPPKAAINVGVIAELLTFVGSDKWWWLIPMLVAVLIFGVLVVLGQGSAVAPFMYKLP